MKFNNSLFYISKYRTEIMGFAILGVMLAHIKTICGFPDTLFNKVLGLICYSVFTGGFLLLSGLGLYHSMHNDDRIIPFYKKRIARLLIPYWIISTPYFIYSDLMIGEGVFPFLGHLFTLSFWVYGNFSGMWYIALSVVLYALYPLLYVFLFCRNNRNDKSLHLSLFLLIVFAVVNFMLKVYAPAYLDKISVAICGIPLFIIGSLIMHWIVSKKEKPELFESVEIALMGGGDFTCQWHMGTNKYCVGSHFINCL